MVLVSEGNVSNLEIHPTLVEQIKKAQQGHPSIEGIKKKMNLGKASEFVTDSEGTLWTGTDFAYLTLRSSSNRS